MRGHHQLLDVDINITARCNLRCEFCSVSVLPVSKVCDELSLLELERLFVELENMGVNTVRIVGGEPFVRRDIEDVIRLLGSFGFFSSILTNGTTIKKRHVELIKSCGIDVLALSVDGDTPAVHDASRGKQKSFEGTLRTIDLCNEIGVRHRMMTAVTSRSLPHLERIVEFADKSNFELLNFILLGLGGAANESPSSFPTYAEWSRSIVSLTKFLHKSNYSVLVSLLFPHEDEIPIELYDPLERENILPLLESVWGINYSNFDRQRWVAQSRCVAGHSSLSILPNGDVFGCDLMQSLPALKVGNFRKERLNSIFQNSPLLRRWREVSMVNTSANFDASSRNFSCGQCRAGVQHQQNIIARLSSRGEF
ncbi:putative Fe-S oxidoreductase [Pseudomonas sp. GM79]|uniref:radical SAM protein n=1 Tax=Pseudomonas sp. GM79 TaxID=1144338 RepID=UPI00026F6A2B|nr:radical SAM protein [Pseudomonas sp. GM79]EJN25884.1 putative Fe-S oxidoreductase [Pseudomonas sp. GM79]